MNDFARAVVRCEREMVQLGPDATRRFDWSAVPRWPAR
jgi:hypothetical protein